MKPVLVTLVAAALVAGAAAFATDRAAARPLMAPLYSELRVLLPLTVPPSQLGEPKNRAVVKRSLTALAKDADALAAHARAEEPGMRFLGRSIAADARMLLHTWNRGRYEESAFALHEMTRYCVACHSTLPSDSSPLSKGFLDDTRLARLPADERAQLLLATRQFDAGLLALESFFADPSVHPSRMLGPLADYLITTVRVTGDLVRPQRALAKLRARTDAWTNLRDDIDAWLAALARFKEQPPVATLEGARALIDEAQELSRYPADRRALVHWIAAMSSLHRVLATGTLPAKDAAEAYLLLTLAEARIEQNLWLVEAEEYLSSCVRLAPHSELAERCYALLEEQTLLAFAGTAAKPLPDDVEQRLRALEVLARPEP